MQLVAALQNSSVVRRVGVGWPRDEKSRGTNRGIDEDASREVEIPYFEFNL